MRAVFERGARDSTEKLEVGAPGTDLVADVPTATVTATRIWTSTPPRPERRPRCRRSCGPRRRMAVREPDELCRYYRRLADAGFTVVSVGYSLAPRDIAIRPRCTS